MRIVSFTTEYGEIFSEEERLELASYLGKDLAITEDQIRFTKARPSETIISIHIPGYTSDSYSFTLGILVGKWLSVKKLELLEFIKEKT